MHTYTYIRIQNKGWGSKWWQCHAHTCTNTHTHIQEKVFLKGKKRLSKAAAVKVNAFVKEEVSKTALMYQCICIWMYICICVRVCICIYTYVYRKGDSQEPQGSKWRKLLRQQVVGLLRTSHPKALWVLKDSEVIYVCVYSHIHWTYTCLYN